MSPLVVLIFLLFIHQPFFCNYIGTATASAAAAQAYRAPAGKGAVAKSGGNTKEEWVKRCVADYEQKYGGGAVAKQQTTPAPNYGKKPPGDESSEEHYPINYEPAFKYEKLRVSDIIYPLKVHAKPQQKVQQKQQNYATIAPTTVQYQQQSASQESSSAVDESEEEEPETSEEQPSSSAEMQGHETAEETHEHDGSGEHSTSKSGSDEGEEHGEQYNEQRSGGGDSEEGGSSEEDSTNSDESDGHHQEGRRWPYNLGSKYDGGHRGYRPHSGVQRHSDERRARNYAHRRRPQHRPGRREKSRERQMERRGHHSNPFHSHQQKEPFGLPPPDERHGPPAPPKPAQQPPSLSSTQQTPTQKEGQKKDAVVKENNEEQTRLAQQLNGQKAGEEASKLRRASRCPRKSVQKCSAFSRCADGSGQVQNCWFEGDDMVFDEATQECRSFMALPDCLKDNYCADKPKGPTLLGGTCSKVTIICGFSGKRRGDKPSICKHNKAKHPMDKGRCIHIRRVSDCAELLA